MVLDTYLLVTGFIEIDTSFHFINHAKTWFPQTWRFLTPVAVGKAILVGLWTEFEKALKMLHPMKGEQPMVGSSLEAVRFQ